MILIRALFLFAAEHGFSIGFKHIPGCKNDIADAISRLQHSRFRQLAPQADTHATTIPPEVFVTLSVAMKEGSKN